MKTYRIRNRETGQWWEGQAPSYRVACENLGWLISDCWIRVFIPTVEDPASDKGYKYGGWENVKT